MGKKIKKILCGFLMMSAAALMARCSGNSDSEPPIPVSTVISATLIVDVDYAEDVLALFDVNLECTAPSGKKETESITETTTHKEFEFSSFPASCSLNAVLTRKEGVELTESYYKFGHKVSRKLEMHMSHGTTKSRNLEQVGSMPGLAVGANKVELYAEQHADDIGISMTLELNEDKTDVVTD